MRRRAPRHWLRDRLLLVAACVSALAAAIIMVTAAALIINWSVLDVIQGYRLMVKERQQFRSTQDEGETAQAQPLAQHQDARLAMGQRR